MSEQEPRVRKPHEIGEMAAEEYGLIRDRSLLIETTRKRYEDQIADLDRRIDFSRKIGSTASVSYQAHRQLAVEGLESIPIQTEQQALEAHAESEKFCKANATALYMLAAFEAHLDGVKLNIDPIVIS